MGWFWADEVPATATPATSRPGPPSSCPMHNKTVDAFNPSAKKPDASSTPPSSCPVKHDKAAGSSKPPASCPVKHDKAVAAMTVPPSHGSSASSPQPNQQSVLSKLNPLNYMFPDLSNEAAPKQTMALPTEREASTIPRGPGEGNWEYPSPQQMYHALLRKGYTDTDPAAVEPMVAIHNFLNEGAWEEIVEWERRFGKGLARGWQISKQGEERAPMILRRLEAMEAAKAGRQAEDEYLETQPSLVRFQGRPKDMTPKAAFFQALGWVAPGSFGGEPPFDRHDWYVRRSHNGQEKEVRYVIDYYSGPPEPTGEPVFFLDVRPAMTPTTAVERLMRWGGDVWWRASGAEVRHQGR